MFIDTSGGRQQERCLSLAQDVGSQLFGKRHHLLHLLHLLPRLPSLLLALTFITTFQMHFSELVLVLERNKWGCGQVAINGLE